ncbi:MAG: polyribonucleotide nucleotidyltransferase, partial [Chloroflexi bacterium]|nr:polyribonucleotide nucleotidyltransferase [Chloroflexota bacterium]
MNREYSLTIGGRELVIETGKLAEQANGAVTVRYGDTVVLVTACCSPQPREGVDFFPLTVDYEERLYAAGKIPGGFFKREGRPTQEAILAMRLTDRCIRPLFPRGFRNEVQVVITVLSADQENDPDILAIIGASAALSTSEIPFAGPLAATRMGYVEGEFVINPTFTELGRSQLDLVVAGTRDAVLMVEAGGSEVQEDIILEAIRRGQEVNKEVIRLQDQLIAEDAKAKIAYVSDEPGPEVVAAVSSFLESRWDQVMALGGKGEREEALATLKSELVAALGESYPEKSLVASLESQVKALIRAQILDAGIRPSGRGLNEIRPISCEVGLLPRTHGSGLFTRGQTQVLTIATLGSGEDEQILDGLTQEESKRFMHHYNFPPFSTGEVKRMGSPARREVGHGALAERALTPVIPSEEEFPYTIRLVSEVLSSNGSTSMASVCGSSLSLMDAGVPIKAPVAGIAMGLVMGDNVRYAVLTDIEGVEDAWGDMDFK